MRSFKLAEFLARYVAYFALVAVIVVFGVLSPDRFLTFGNLGVVLQNSAVLAIVAIGITFIIIAGSIDLSVGSVMAFSGAIAATYAGDWGAWAIVLAPLVGAALGAVNRAPRRASGTASQAGPGGRGRRCLPGTTAATAARL